MLLNLIKSAIKQLTANKGRTFLTVLGVVIGMATVIIVYSAGAGAESLILGQVEAFGTDIIQTEIKVPSNKQGTESETESAMALASGVQITSLTLEDMEDITKASQNVSAAYGAATGQEQISYGGETKRAMVMGVSPDFIKIDASQVERGRWFTEAEDKTLSQVVVLGQNVADDLFGLNDPLGKFINIRGKKFQVIGVMEERGAVMYIDFDDYIYLPVRTLQKKVMGIDHIVYMVHQLIDPSKADQTAAEARFVLRQNHDISDPARDDFRTVTMKESLEMLDTITNTLTLLLLAIVSISLIVGGVGIMNIMYVIIAERTSEIGLRKAVGARPGDILLQFLTESVVITFLGSLVGVVFGLGAAYLISLAANSFGLDWEFSVPAQSFVVAIGFALVCGVLFGLFPARQAARMEPVDALRQE